MIKSYRLCVLGFLTWLGACIAPPQPFVSSGQDALTQLPGVLAIRIDLVDFQGTTSLEYALTGALGARDLPAYIAEDAPAGAYRLRVTNGTPVRAELTDAKGAALAAFDADLTGATQLALAKGADQLARKVADRLLPNDPTLVPVPDARVAVLSGQGAPGDGNDALAEAMVRILRGRVPLDDAPSTENYVVTARVSVKRQGNLDNVALVWLILDPKGREAARMTQANQVAAGTLDRTWGPVAAQAAAAAADALIPVLRDLPASPPR